MAIVFDEERENRVGLPTIFGWLALLIIVGGAVYFIFFRRPDVLPLFTPPELQNAQEIAELNLDPQTVVNDPEFQKRVPHVPAGAPPRTGRQNPFI
ncbi:MAG: hypothetical protein HY436_00065, partial [Candidatus Liptonbacteria bacterium]|nr:hypothetical protein [Candidatus Liptonbacteria bacterium]